MMVLCHTPTEKEENTQQDTGSGSNLRTTYVMVKSFRPKPSGFTPQVRDSPPFYPVSYKLTFLSFTIQTDTNNEYSAQTCGQACTSADVFDWCELF